MWGETKIEQVLRSVACYTEVNNADIWTEFRAHQLAARRSLSKRYYCPVLCFINTETTPRGQKREDPNLGLLGKSFSKHGKDQAKGKKGKKGKKGTKGKNSSADADFSSSSSSLDLINLCFVSPLIRNERGIAVFLVRCTPELKRKRIQAQFQSQQRCSFENEKRGENEQGDGVNSALYFPALQYIFHDPTVLKFVFGKHECSSSMRKYGFQIDDKSQRTSWFDMQKPRPGSQSLLTLSCELSRILGVEISGTSLGYKKLTWNRCPLPPDLVEQAKKDMVHLVLLVFEVLGWATPVSSTPRRFLVHRPFGDAQRAALQKYNSAVPDATAERKEKGGERGEVKLSDGIQKIQSVKSI